MFEMGESVLRLLFFWGGILFFLILELIIPYRSSSISKVKRWINNLSLTLFNSILLQLIFSAAIIATVGHVQANKLGILNMFEAPAWIKILSRSYLWILSCMYGTS